MNYAADSLDAFLEREYKLVIIEIKQAFGSTPREAGAFMLVSPTDAHGTIGGGQMEHLAIDNARALLAGVSDQLEMDIPLGPDIGQCCGGRVILSFRIGDEAARAALDARSGWIRFRKSGCSVPAMSAGRWPMPCCCCR
jgi:xanthine dehydrogenase accessory factor